MNDTGNIRLRHKRIDRRPRPMRNFLACSEAASRFQSIYHQTSDDPVTVSALIYAIDARSPAPTGTFPANGAGQIAIACGTG